MAEEDAPDERGTSEDWAGVVLALGVFLLGVSGALAWKPPLTSVDDYFAVIGAFVTAVAIPIALSKVAQRFSATRIWPTFEKSMLAVAAIWALILAVAGAMV